LDTKIHPRCKPRMQGSRKPGYIIDPAVDAGFRETWRRRDGGAGRCENRGNSVIHQPTPREREAGATRGLKPKAKPEDEARRETCSDIGRRSREERSSRETESSSTGGAEEREIRGNSKIRCRYSRKMQEPGQPGTCIGRRSWKSEAARKLAADATDALKDTRVGATRRSIAGRAGRCKYRENRDASRGATGEIELRGNPGLEDRWKRRMDSNFRATWRSNAGKTRGCGVRGNLQPHRETLFGSARLWGDPQIQRRWRRRMREERRLESPSRAQTLRCSIQGNLGT